MIEAWVLVLSLRYGAVISPETYPDKNSCVQAIRNTITVDSRYPNGANDILTTYSGYCIPIRDKK